MKKLLVELDPFLVKVREGRQRSSISEADVDALATSIENSGQIQPIGVDEENFLIWGETRLRACKQLKRKITAVVVPGLSEGDKFELELVENLHRRELSPIDDCLAKTKLHEYWMESRYNEEWSLRKSAAALGMTHVQLGEEIKFTFYIKARPKDFINCKTKSDIRRKVRNIENALSLKLRHQEVEKKIQQKAEEDSEDTSDGKNFTVTMVGDPPIEKNPKDKVQKKLLEYNSRLITGNFFDLSDSYIRDESVDIVLADPMYGTQTDGEERYNNDFDDSKEKFRTDFPLFCRIIYQKMAIGSHLYCFFGISNHNFVYSSLENAGFAVNKIPLIIWKKGIRSAFNPGIWPPNCYEPVAFARKGPRCILQRGANNVIEIPWISPKEKLGHTYAKPPEIYSELLNRSAMPGDLILDPMFGTGTSFVACERMGQTNLEWIGFDLDPENKKRALVNLYKEVKDDNS